MLLDGFNTSVSQREVETYNMGVAEQVRVKSLAQALLDICAKALVEQ